MRYKCSDCEEYFNEDNINKIDNGNYEEYFGAKVWMPCVEYFCPYCGSDDIEEYHED